MHIIALVLCLMVSMTARAQAPAEGSNPGYHAKVRAYSTTMSNPKTELWTAVFRGQEVEFDVEARSGAKSFCVGTFFLNTPGKHGFVIHARDGDEKNERWFFMPKDLNRDENWCFDARRSYRFQIWLIPANKGDFPKYWVNFEVEQVFPFVTDLRLGSPDFRQRSKLCTERFCSDVIHAK